MTDDSRTDRSRYWKMCRNRRNRLHSESDSDQQNSTFVACITFYCS